MKVAVIDIGSLKVKLLIARVDKSGNYKPIYQSNILTCLGCHMEENQNKPLKENLAETIKELIRCRELINKHKVKKTRVVSTHALREMGSIGQQIAKEISQEVGFKIEIISQEQEARLFFKAVIADFKPAQDYTVVDVGGGSVQILLGNKHVLKDVFLLKTGAQVLFDRFSPRHSGADFPFPEEISQMKQYIRQQLAPLPKNTKTPLIYGSSCIIDVFKAIKIKLEPYIDSPANPYKVSVKKLEEFLQTFIPLPYDEREKKFFTGQKYYTWGLDKALLNIISIARIQNSPFIIPTNSNINDGLIQSLLD